MPDESSQPVTQQQLREALDTATAALTAAIQASQERTIETMRDMQTEILRGIEAFARGNFAPMVRL